MPLTALMILGEDDPAFDVLGVPVFEFQMRRAVMAGARHIVILVQRMPASLHAAAAALQRDRIGVDIARSIADAVEFVHPEDRVLVCSPRTMIMAPVLAELCAQPGPAILTLDRAAPYPQLEIVDALSRWTGYALLDGRILREATASIGEWELGSVVLRILVQRHVAQIRVDSEAMIVALDTRHAAHSLGRRLINGERPREAGLGQNAVTEPLARWLGGAIGRFGGRAVWSERTALILCLIAIGSALAGWIALPLVLTVLARVAARATAVLRNATGNPARWPIALASVVGGSAAAVVCAAGTTLAALSGQWGALLLAFAFVGTTALLMSYRRQTVSRWPLADGDALIGLVTVAALFDAPVTGLMLATLVAAGSVAAIRFDESAKP